MGYNLHMHTNHTDVVRSEDAHRAAAYEKYATAARRHKAAQIGYTFDLRVHGPHSPLTHEALSMAAEALMRLSDAAAQYRRAKVAALEVAA